MSRTGTAAQKRTFSKISNWRHYSLKNLAKRKKNCQNRWEWLTKPFRKASKSWKWCNSKEIGFRTSQSKEMLNGVSLLVNSCLKDKIGRVFYIALWPETKNASTTIIPSAGNRGEFPGMPELRWPDRIFTVRRLCSAFGGIISVWCIMSCWNEVKPSKWGQYRTQSMRPSPALKEKRPQYQKRHDKVITLMAHGLAHQHLRFSYFLIPNNNSSS